MTIYYCGAGGNNGNSGLSWALRRLTLNGIEDVPVVAGDTVYIGPGVYRETLTVDVSGTAGNPITYIADVTGEHTDEVGGIVRITGSDNDQTATRTNAITASSKNYRTFTGFYFDTTTGAGITLTDCTNWIVQDCPFAGSASIAINVAGASQANTTIRRCVFFGGGTHCVVFTHTATVDNTAQLVENCLLLPNAAGNGVQVARIGGVTVKNSCVMGGIQGLRVQTALAVGQLMTVNHCIITGCTTGLNATVTTEFSEDYNSVFACGTARTNVTAGSNSVAYSPLFAPPILLAGVRYPWAFGALSQWSPLAAKVGTAEASDDLFGMTRPVTSSKKSWGAVQFSTALAEITTIRNSPKSLKLSNAGRKQMFIPTTNVSTTFSCYVQWEADYAGTKPQMIIKQPGQADATITATGSSGSWEELTTTLTPAEIPDYVVIEFVSNNTATSGNYDVFFTDFSVG